MREILFRGKQDNKWIYGYFVQALDIENKPIKSFIIKDMATVPIGGGCVKQDYYEIELNTLGQYTGLTDKNGTKIFEGDIVKDVVEPCPKGIIKFGNYETPYKEWGKLSDNPFMKNLGFFIDWCVINFRKDLGFWSNRVEVIGNIYDNPELLGKVEE